MVAHRAPTMDNSASAEFDAGGVGRRERVERSVDAKEVHFAARIGGRPAPGTCEGPRVNRTNDIATQIVS